MKRRLFSLAVCFILVLGLFSFSFSLVHAPSGDGVVEVNVPPRGTFLHAIDGFPYHGAGDKVPDETLGLNVIIGSYYNVEDPAIVDLHAEGFTEGDKIIITYTAKLYYDGTYHPTNPDAAGWPVKDETELFWGGLLGVFSTTSNLKDIKEADRVPDAVNSGISGILTPTTRWDESLQEISDKLRVNGIAWYTGPEDTDIPYDFKISNPHQGFEMTIPRNARFLFLCCIDDMYYDNLGEIKVTIEKDTDLDGIPDHWEINGIDINNDGKIDLDLPMLGADWEHKDIFVEIDYMGSSAGHDHKPVPTTISDVIQAFSNAPVNNPDNVRGINLHVVVDDEIPHENEISFDDVRSKVKNQFFGTKAERTDANKKNILDAKKIVFHYCLFAHKQPGGNWGGMGEVIGNDFMVSLGAGTGQVGTVDEQTEVFMHELGHNLGLRHGGNEQTNFKPNYISIMNYLFQYDSYNTGRPLDFSSGNKAVLIESSLDENNGIGDRTTTVWRLANGTMAKSSGAINIDWNADGNITANVNMNLNHNPPDFPSDAGETLTDYNDWANLVYRFRGYPNFAFGLEPESHHELTWEQIQAMKEENIIEVTIPESQIPINEKVSVGVKQGDWMEYSVSYTGTPSDDLTKWFRVEVEKVEGTNITAYFEVERINGEKFSFSETYDLKVGFHDAIIISSGLDLGDQFFHDQFGSISIEDIEDYGYAGEERTVVAAIFSDNIAHWDKNTGVLTQLDWSQSPDLKHHWLIEKTSLWGETGIDTMLLVGFGVAIVAVLLIILLFFRRKKKKSEIERNPKNKSSPKY